MLLYGILNGNYNHVWGGKPQYCNQIRYMDKSKCTMYTVADN